MSGDGGPAFPRQYSQHEVAPLVRGEGSAWVPDPSFGEHDGMSLRDYFAGQAVLSLRSGYDRSEMGVEAYKIADAMLAERDATP